MLLHIGYKRVIMAKKITKKEERTITWTMLLLIFFVITAILTGKMIFSILTMIGAVFLIYKISIVWNKLTEN